MSIALYFLAIILAACMESLFLQIPLTLVIIIAAASVFQKKEWVFLLCFIAGVIVDSLTFRTLGLSSLFFLITVGIIYLYQRKFETNHMLFGIISTCIATLCYVFFFQIQQVFLALFINSILGASLFFLASRVFSHNKKVSAL